MAIARKVIILHENRIGTAEQYLLVPALARSADCNAISQINTPVVDEIVIVDDPIRLAPLGTCIAPKFNSGPQEFGKARIEYLKVLRGSVDHQTLVLDGRHDCRPVGSLERGKPSFERDSREFEGLSSLGIDGEHPVP